MKPSDINTQSVYAFIKSGVDLMPEIEDRHGQMHPFTYDEFEVDPVEGILFGELVTDDGATFKITVERIS